MQGAARRAPRLHRPPTASRALREAVAADLHGATASTVDPAASSVVPGGKVTMFFAMLMFGEPGRRDPVPQPRLPDLRVDDRLLRRDAGAYRAARGHGFSFAADEVLAQDHAAHAAADHQQPGQPHRRRRAAKAELDRLVAGLERHPQVAVLSDEIYARTDLRRRARTPRCSTYPELRDRLILLDGWRKTYAMTGWRLGYGRLAGGAGRGARRGSRSTAIPASTPPTQFAGIAALEGPAGRRSTTHGRGLRRAPRGHRRGAQRAARRPLRARPAAPSTPSPTSRAPASTRAQLQDRLLDEAGVATIAGTSFGACGEGYVRFSYANSVENIQTALQRLEEMLKAKVTA